MARKAGLEVVRFASSPSGATQWSGSLLKRRAEEAADVEGKRPTRAHSALPWHAMFRRKVRDPHGRRWTLGRHWMPRRKRWEKADIDMPDWFPDFGGDDIGIFAAIFLTIAAVILAALLALLLFNVVVLAIEITIIVLGLIIGLFSRVVLRKPWTVFVKSGPHTVERHVVGWRASRRLIRELAGEIESGRFQLALQDRR